MGRPLPKYIVNSIKCTCKIGEEAAEELDVVRQSGRGRFIVSADGVEHEITLVAKADFETNQELGTGFIKVTVGEHTYSLAHLTTNLIIFFEAVEPATFVYDLILDEGNRPIAIFQPDGVAKINGILGKATVTFTINPDPADATVKLNGEEKASIEVKAGSEVAWEVSKETYTTRTGKVFPMHDATLDVNLEAAE